ncbi:hypothetical protein HK100_005078 [Physocladia obscura]|uniref:Kinesin-like protein n=1 Tax=Physocladia obscura TaxID=109957 RepID=A0AAD5T7R7_9FUNG|nr:hypothetical protein HK100_005078 [Physocladia obscura]
MFRPPEAFVKNIRTLSTSTPEKSRKTTSTPSPPKQQKHSIILQQHHSRVNTPTINQNQQHNVDSDIPVIRIPLTRFSSKLNPTTIPFSSQIPLADVRITHYEHELNEALKTPTKLIKLSGDRNKTTVSAASVSPQAQSAVIAHSITSAITTPSKTAIEVAKLKAARDLRRAAAAETKLMQNRMLPSEKETSVYRTEIAQFREQYFGVLMRQAAESGKNYSAEGETLMDDETTLNSRIRVCVRKKPMSKKAIANKAYDVATTSIAQYPHSNIYIHEPKTRLDQSKFIETHKFLMDLSFDEHSTNEQVYLATGRPLVKSIFEGGMCTFFAYGQTGSGKTHTIFGTPTEPGIYSYICHDIFSQISQLTSSQSSTTQIPPKYHLRVSFFEIYGPKIKDLLAKQQQSNYSSNHIQLCEDKHGAVVLMNLHEEIVTDSASFMGLVNRGRGLRTTRATAANSESSRSHAIFQIRLMSGIVGTSLDALDGAGTNSYGVDSSSATKTPPMSLMNQQHGVLSLVDLAGSERGVDTNQVGSQCKRDKKTQSEAAEINKSLLSLKECIRSLYKRGIEGTDDCQHVPFRGSKLTHILRDSFLNKESRTVMVATISPGSNFVEHTLNTLRYADRVKELGRDPVEKDINCADAKNQKNSAFGVSIRKYQQWAPLPPANELLASLQNFSYSNNSANNSSQTDRTVHVQNQVNDIIESDNSAENRDFAELQHNRNLVSSLGVYGAESDTDEETDEKTENAQNTTLLGGYRENMEAFRNFTLLTQQLAPAVVEMTQDSEKIANHLNNEISQTGSENESYKDEYFYQDALSIESGSEKVEQEKDTKNTVEIGEEQDSERYEKIEGEGSQEFGPENELEEQKKELVIDSDSDAAEWRRYCGGSAARRERERRARGTSDEAVRMQEQFHQLETVLLERVRSGRIGLPAYFAQTRILLAERMQSLEQLCLHEK